MRYEAQSPEDVVLWRGARADVLAARQVLELAQAEAAEARERERQADEDRKAAAVRFLELRSRIEYHKYRYHRLEDPVISDADYDALVREERALAQLHGWKHDG